MDLSIIIVNYNTIDLLKQTIQSVLDSTKNIQYEIIVSDNNSHDGSQEMVRKNFAKVMLIENKGNLGFSKANNIAIKKSKGRYVLLLNSDTVVLENCMEKSMKYMDKNIDIGVLGCKVVLRDGTLDHACRRGFPTPEASLFYMLKLDKLFPGNEKFSRYTMSYLHEDSVNEVDSLTGAFMMVKREAVDKVGFLDENFFMYGEDIDWCFRIKESGFKVVYYPRAKIIHYKGASSKKKRLKTIYEFHRAMILFYNKHYLHKYNFFVTFLVYIGISLKLILTLFRNLFRKRG